MVVGVAPRVAGSGGGVPGRNSGVVFRSGRVGYSASSSIQGVNVSVAKVLELSARSPESFEDAIAIGIAKASESVHGIREAWVNQMTVQVEDSAVVGYQVDMKITFVID